MRVGSSTRRIAMTGLLAGSLTMGLTVSALSAGASAKVVHPRFSNTLTLPLPPKSYMKWIWPMVTPARFTVTNVSRFEQPMYRPLFWFGKGFDTKVQIPLSLATLKITGTTKFLITMKGWNWSVPASSGGGVITAKDVMFFLNMYANHPLDYGGYFPGFGIPDGVKSATVNAANTQLTIITKAPVNTTWFLYNALAELTPMPKAWDITHNGAAPGSGGCANSSFTNNQAHPGTGPCDAVFTYMTSLATARGAAGTGYNDNPIWKIADGPWKLGSYDNTALPGPTVVLVPNHAYGGPQQAQVDSVTWLAQSSLATEETQLESGAFTSGYVDPALVNSAPTPGSPGTNKLSYFKSNGWSVTTGPFWGFDYAYFNFFPKSSGTHLTNQQYIRAALEEGINQGGQNVTLYNNYSVKACSPLPALADPFAKGAKCAYKYDQEAAQDLLQANGWTLGHPATCTKAQNKGACGPGTHTGDKLKLTYEYPSGSTVEDAQIAGDVSSWAAIGFQITTKSIDSNTVANDCLSGPSTTSGMPAPNRFIGDNGDWQICQYGGWVYSPGAYPSGEQLFLTGSASNSGLYSSAMMDKLIKQSISSSAKLAAYGTFASKDLPVLYQTTPLGVGELWTHCVHGTLDPSPLSDFMPEYASRVC